MDLVIATFNQGKLKEYEELLRSLHLRLLSLPQIGITKDVEEVGTTFRENALLKARSYTGLSQRWVLADDSGLEVDALGGAPGVYSARYSGPGANDARNIELLLHNLQGVPPAARTARFRCVIALATPDGRAWTCCGARAGIIAAAPRGSYGFGYDPVFFMPDRGVTMAELLPEEKNRISHRASAALQLRGLFPILAYRPCA